MANKHQETIYLTCPALSTGYALTNNHANRKLAIGDIGNFLSLPISSYNYKFVPARNFNLTPFSFSFFPMLTCSILNIFYLYLGWGKGYKITGLMEMKNCSSILKNSFAFFDWLKINEVSIKWFMLRKDHTLPIDSKAYQF